MPRAFAHTARPLVTRPWTTYAAPACATLAETTVTARPAWTPPAETPSGAGEIEVASLPQILLGRSAAVPPAEQAIPNVRHLGLARCAIMLVCMIKDRK